MAENGSGELEVSNSASMSVDDSEKSSQCAVMMVDSVQPVNGTGDDSAVRPHEDGNPVGNAQGDSRAIPHVQNKQSESLLKTPPDPKLDLSVSPETPGSKRKRVQHNYRRLSSSGYLDDYEGKDRFTGSTAENDIVDPVSPKGKSPGAKIKPLGRGLTETMVNGVAPGT